MDNKLGIILACSVLASCMSSDQSGLTNKADQLDAAVVQVAADVTLEEIKVVDEVQEGELITAPFFDDEHVATVSAKTAVGAYDVGGYACNVIHDPQAEYVWSIHRYNLNDSLNTSQMIFGVTDNRKIQSVACTPDGAFALFSVKQSKNGDYEVYSINLLTDQVTQLTNNATDDVDVTMSVDGLKMAWQERLADNRQAITIRTYNNDRTTFTQKGLASANPLVQPSLSPNGEWLALVQLRNSNFLALRYDVVNAKFTTIKSIVRRKKLFLPSVSDDGNTYGWVENSKLTRFLVRDIENNQTTLLFTNPEGEGIRHPKISFDGNWVSYSLNNDDSRKTLLRHIESGEVSMIGEELASPARYLATNWMGTYVYPEDLQIDLSEASVSESGQSFQGVVSRSGTGVEPLVVSLSSSDESELVVPSTISFGVGDFAKSFTVQPVDDQDVDGSQFVTVSATAPGADSVSAEVEVLDDGEMLPELALTSSALRVTESGNSVAFTVSLPEVQSSAVKIVLSSSDNSEVTMPASVTVAAGTKNRTFNVSAVQDFSNDGNQSIVISAAAAGFEDGSYSLNVIDAPVNITDETQVSFDALGNLSIYDVGNTNTSEFFNINIQNEDGVSYLQVNDVNGNVMQINQAGSAVFFTKPAKRTAIRVPVDLVNSLTIDTKGGTNQIDLRADLSLSRGVRLVSEIVNVNGVNVETLAGGVSIDASQQVQLSAAVLSSTTGNILINGNATSSGSCLGTIGNFVGVELLNSASLTTGSGDVKVTGCGGTTGSKNTGVKFSASGGTIVATGNGSVSVIGHAGEGLANNIGVALQGSSSQITALSGDITIEGFGDADHAGDFNPGVAIQDGAKVVLSGSSSDFVSKVPKVTISGTTKDAQSRGFSINGSGSTVQTKDASIDISGSTLSSTEPSLYLSGAVLATGSGSVSLNGDEVRVLAATMSTASGKLSVDAERNVLLSEGVLSSLTGDIYVSANVDGDACSGTPGNFAGVELVSQSKIETANGHIDIKGCGGNSGSSNIGVQLATSGGKVVVTDSGDVSLVGIAGSGEGNNIGVAVQGSDSIVSANAGSIEISGMGSQSSSGDFNPAVAIQNGGQVVSLADEADNATVTITGNSTLGTGAGVNLGGGSQIFTKDAPLMISGQNSITATDSDPGVYLNGTVQSNGLATIDIAGSDVRVLDTSILGTLGDVVLTADRAIVVSDGSVNTTSGALSLSANMSGVACAGQAGNFAGVELLNESTVKTESGVITVSGCGGTTGSSNTGIKLSSSGGKIFTDSGDLNLLGLAGSGVNTNIGVAVQGSESYVKTNSGSIVINGKGSVASSGPFNPGVSVQDGGYIQSDAGASKYFNITGSGGSSFQEFNHGISVSAGGSHITTTHAPLNLNGSGGGKSQSLGKNMGVYINATVNSVGVAPINIVGLGGNGDSDNDAVRVGGEGSEIKSLAGDINIRGVGSSATFGDGNKGVRVSTDGKITAAGSANISIYGIGGTGGAKNQGIHVVGSAIPNAESEAIVSAVNGDIKLEGLGNTNSTGNANTGVNVVTYGFVETTGLGNIEVIGEGGNGGINHYGVGLFNGGEIRTLGSGGIKIDGTGGVGNLGNSGLRLAGQLPQENPNKLPLLYAKISSAEGPIDIVALGGNGDGGTPPTEAPWSEEDHGMQGIYLNHGGWIEALGDATINIETVGGDGYNETHGLFMEGEENFEPGEVEHDLGLTSFITSVDGDINIVGYGNRNNSVGNSFGVGLVFSQINASGSGNIYIKGIGGSGNKRPTHGIQINQELGLVSSFNGSITLEGYGGIGTANGNAGVKVVDGAHVLAEGASSAASITIKGVGGEFGNNANHGVQINTAANSHEDTTVEVNNGDITIIGTGVGTSAGSNNFGVSLSSASQDAGGKVVSHGQGKITINGTGGVGTSSNGGVQIANGLSKISSVNGDISVTGVGSTISTGDANAGIYMYSGMIESTGSANIIIDGTGGSGTKYNEGLTLLDDNAAIASTDGYINITAVGGDGAEDLRFYDPEGEVVGYIGGASATGDIILNIDSLHSVLGSMQSSGGLTIQPRTGGHSIGIGGGVNDGALNISGAELANFADGFSKIKIGRPNAGLVTIGSLLGHDPYLIEGSVIEGVTAYPMHVNMSGADTATLSGVISPRRSTSGQSLGKIVTSGRIKFAQGSEFAVSIKGLRAGNAHDQLIIDDSLNLNNAALAVEFIDGYQPTLGSSYVIVDNQGGNPVVSTFANLSEGSAVQISGYTGSISYVGGDGNDVELNF